MLLAEMRNLMRTKTTDKVWKASDFIPDFLNEKSTTTATATEKTLEQQIAADMAFGAELLKKQAEQRAALGQ
jgi:hypothetical protein